MLAPIIRILAQSINHVPNAGSNILKKKFGEVIKSVLLELPQKIEQ